ncbi:MAG TPA: NADH-quinone oxidoreductase subunit A, partial [bacterium]|nr:NADH-quinone oxidoreductase subunit A [bacterium]
IIANRLLMPYDPTPEKLTTYECGVDPVGSGNFRYNIRFYVFALLYVIFAVEAVFLLPWAVVYTKMEGMLPLVEVLIFVFILILGLAYAWKKGELKWD